MQAEPIVKVHFSDYPDLELQFIPQSNANGALTGLSVYYTLGDDHELTRVNTDVVQQLFKPTLAVSENGVFTLALEPLPSMQLIKGSKGWKAIYTFASVAKRAPLSRVEIKTQNEPFDLQITVQGLFRKNQNDKGETLTDCIQPPSNFVEKLRRFLENV